MTMSTQLIAAPLTRHAGVYQPPAARTWRRLGARVAAESPRGRAPRGAGALRGALGPGARTVLLLGLASFFNDVASDMVLTLLPIYLAGTLGVSVAAVGLIEGVAESTAAFTRLAAGRLSDALPRRLPLVIGGYTVSALARPLLALGGGAWPAGGVRFADRLGKGVRSAPRDALIADVAVAARRGLAFGLHRAADTAGAVAGVLLAALVLVLAGAQGGLSRDAFRAVVLVAAVPGVLAVLLLTRVRELPRTAPPARQRAPARARFGLPSLPAERRYLLVVFVFALGNSSDAFVILRLVDAGVGLVALLLLVAGRHLVEALLSLPASALSDRLGRRRLLLAGYAVYALIYAGYATVESPLVLTLLTLAYGAYYGATEGASRAFVADLAGPAERGRAFGWYHFAVAVALLPASIIAGVLWQSIDPAATFALGAACALAAALLLTTVRPPTRAHEA
jgi:MFS family permease